MLILVGMMVGIVGGLVGGVAGYHVALAGVPANAAAMQSSNAKASNQATVISDLRATEYSVVDTVKQAEPAVVTIIGTFQQQSRRLSNSSITAEGSGVIIDRQGHIVTNAHVIDGARQIEVVFHDGAKASARLVGADATSDIAVLQVSGRIPAFLPLGNSDTLQVGETVIAIGSPLGNYRGSVTVGVVSGLERSVPGSGLDSLIQTDAAISSGNSGGPLLNLAGEVIGINTLVVRVTSNGNLAEGLGFAIPSNTVAAIAKQFIAKSTAN